MFGKLAKLATQQVEKAVKIDLDGDGKSGDAPPAAGGARALEDGVDLPVSNCKGNKKSLFVGINYFGQQGELKGCLNDVKNIKEFVTTKYGFPTDAAHMRVLTDDQKGENAPTKANMIAAFKWLIEGCQPNDSLFFHYSGHGGSQKDVSPENDEADGKDETLIPVDYAQNGVIVDDDIHELLVKPLPKGVRLTAIMDCCHSASVFDLPFTYTIDGKLEIKETDNRKAAIEAAIAAGKAYLVGDKKLAMSKGIESLKSLVQGPGAQNAGAAEKAVQIRTSLADVIQFSGCRDDQTSADANIAGEATGAMSWALISSLKANPTQSFPELLGSMRKLLQEKYSQVPQMSAGHKLKLAGVQFVM